MLAATEFEFKQRFWIIGAIFFLAFLSYRLDAQNAGTALADWIARVRGTMPSNTAYHLIFFVGALCTVAAAAIRTWGTAYLNSETMIAMRVQTSRLGRRRPLSLPCEIPCISGTFSGPPDLA